MFSWFPYFHYVPLMSYGPQKILLEKPDQPKSSSVVVGFSKAMESVFHRWPEFLTAGDNEIDVLC